MFVRIGAYEVKSTKVKKQREELVVIYCKRLRTTTVEADAD